MSAELDPNVEFLPSYAGSIKFGSGTLADAAEIAVAVPGMYTSFGIDIAEPCTYWLNRCIIEEGAVLADVIAANDAALVLDPANMALLWAETLYDAI